MADPVQDQHLLSSLDGCGIKVDEDGTISDWQDRPARQPRPLEAKSDTSRATRRPFTTEEDELIQLWVASAEAEGITGNEIYEQLEVVCPSHSWQSHKNRWLKTLKSAPPPTLRNDYTFPNLDREVSRQPEQLTAVEETEMITNSEGCHQEGDLEQSEETFSDCRVEIERVLYKRLAVRDVDGLRKLLRQEWVIELYGEFESSLTDFGFSSSGQSREDRPADRIEATNSGQSQHAWKIDRAVFVLSLPHLPSRYGSKNPDKTFWTQDDHDIRFLVRAFVLNKVPDAVWRDQTTNPRESRPLCLKALWLLLWFKWLHKETQGEGREMQRLQRKREEWRAFLQEGRARLNNLRSGTGITPASQARLARRDEGDQQLFLLADEAREFYLRERNLRLAQWGVSPEHFRTCVLMPQAWAATDPVIFYEEPEKWPITEPDQERLKFSLGVHKMLWARAVAWFETWPRSTSDLQYFSSPTTARPERSHMHGSHRCHHSLCITPNHIVYEDGNTNLSRNSCARLAIGLRMYGADIPEHCYQHQPPCLLQFAALTTFETWAIQFGVLALARDLPARPPLIRPEHHPERFATFEQSPTPGTTFQTVGITPEDVVKLSLRQTTTARQNFQWSCRFCSNKRVWQRMTSFWAHLRVNHTEEDQEQILNEVTRSARVYQLWADKRFYDYERKNPNTWQKMIQAQAPDFDWDVFTGWRLTKSRIYEGRKEQNPQSQDEDSETL